MRLPINIEELLGGRAVEGDRIEYKTGWNPDAIYRSVCAFANDFDETGGGYIVVGVKEVNGRAVRPVIGIGPNQIEPIEKDMGTRKVPICAIWRRERDSNPRYLSVR